MTFNNKTKLFWQSCIPLENEYENTTIHSFGTATPLEIPYRCYGELKTFLENIPLNRNMKILELGCGAGRWGIALAPYVAQYVGVDLNAMVIDKANENSKHLNNVCFIVKDAEDFLAETDNVFDLVYVAGISLYYSDHALQNLVCSIFKHLSPAGQLVERTTTSPEAHFINRKNYFALFRNDKSLIKNFCDASDGKLELSNVVRSYYFLRGRYFFQILNKITEKISFLKPLFEKRIALEIMEYISRRVEKLFPSLSKEGDYEYDHKFFFFKKVGSET